jgi:hypothetical protein
VTFKDDRPMLDGVEGGDDRWTLYKFRTRADGREPMSWGEWMRAGQPLPILDDEVDQ